MEMEQTVPHALESRSRHLRVTHRSVILTVILQQVIPMKSVQDVVNSLMSRKQNSFLYVMFQVGMINCVQLFTKNFLNKKSDYLYFQCFNFVP